MPTDPPASLAPDRLVFALGALADRHRLAALILLAREGEMTVTALADRLGVGQTMLSYHLARLRRAGLVAGRRAGMMRPYRIAGEAAGVLDEVRALLAPRETR